MHGVMESVAVDSCENLDERLCHCDVLLVGGVMDGQLVVRC